MVQPGGEIGRYRVVRRVGSGGMAITFLCTLDGAGGFQKHVVIKMLDPNRVDDSRYVNMFLDEARLWARLAHPNIPQVFELGALDGIPYLVMEYVPGPTLHMLSRKLAPDRTLEDLCMIARLGSDVARALDYAYFGEVDDVPNRVVHRDVTLSNILASTNGQAKLIDFGIAMSEDRLSHTEIGTLKGRIQYMAPEQLLDKAVDHQTDIFQLGVTLYALVTGQQVFPTTSKSAAAMWKARMEGEVVPVRIASRGTCPQVLADIIEKCIDPLPANRWSRGEELAVALDDFIEATSPRAVDQLALARWISALFPKQQWRNPSTAVPQTDSVATGSGPVGTAGTTGHSGNTGAGSTGHSLPLTASIAPTPPGVSRSVFMVAIGAMATAAVFGLLVIALGTALMAQQYRSDSADAVVKTDPNREATIYLDEVEKLSSDGRIKEATLILDRARATNPTDAQVIVRLLRVGSELTERALVENAQQALTAGDLETAAEQARELLDRQPTNERALALLEQVSLTTEARKPKEAAPVEPAALGTLVVTTHPPAQVFVDDRLYGTAPLNGLQLAPGNHTVHLRLAGHSALKRSIVIRSANELVIDATLEPIGRPASAAAVEPAAPPEPPAAPAVVEPEPVATIEPPVVAPAPAPPAAPVPVPAPAVVTDVSQPKYLAMGSDVPMSQQALVVAKALTFDTRLRARSGDKLVVASLYNDPNTKKRAVRMNNEFMSYGLSVQGMRITGILLEYTTKDDLTAQITSLGIDLLYVPTGLGASVGDIASAARKTKVITMGAEPSYVASALSLGVFSIDGKPELTVNHNASLAEGVAFADEILKVAVRMD